MWSSNLVTSCVKSHDEHSQISSLTRCTSLKNHAGIIENLDDSSTVSHEQVIRLELAGLVRELIGTDLSDERMLHEQ